MTLNLVDSSPSGTVTVSAFNRLPDDEARLYRLRKIARKNLENTLRILRYNQAYNIKVYRLTSKLIPLATHPLTESWDYISDFKDEFKEIGDFIKDNDFRVSAHPDHYTIINSKSEDIVRASVNDLDYHVRIYEAMGLSDYKYKLVMHVGGLYKSKERSVERFKENFIRLPERIRKRIILENDDKSYSASDVLGICKDISVPMVLDVHHHNCINNGEKIEDFLPEVFNTWDGEYFSPKIHFSTPKSCTDFRSHANDIDLKEFTDFLNIAKKVGKNFDVMLEAKNKDSALFKLSEQLGEVRGIKKISESEFEI